MFNSFKARVLAVISSLVLVTAFCIAIFQQFQTEAHVLNSEMAHARNLLKMAAVHIENQHASYLFYREALLNERKRDLQNILEVVFVEIENLYKKVQAKELTELEAQQVAMDFARRIRYANGIGYVWFNNTEKPHPKIIMHSTMPELDGQRMDSEEPLFNSAIGKEKNLFKAIVEVCDADGQGFVEYFWPKPGVFSPIETQPKISFVRLFKPWNWIAGTGLYIDDIERDSKLRIDAIVKELRQAFAKIKLGENSYLFIFDGNYDVLVHPQYSGKNLSGLKNPLTEKVLMDELKNASKNPDQAMIYRWNKPTDSDDNLTYTKHAYVHYFAPLDWYIVASVYQDELSAPIVDLRWKLMLIISALLMLALVIASRFARNLSKPLQKLVDAAQKIEADGISAAEIEISGTMEIQKLGLCLNSMLSSIKNAADERDALFKEIQNEGEKYRATLNSIADAVIFTDISGKILGMNPMAEDLTGWQNIQATGCDLCEVYKVFYGNNQIQSDNPVDKILQANQLGKISADGILTAKNGQQYNVSESGAPIRSENGEIKGVVLVFRNVTEEFQNQHKLKDAEWKFQALFEHGSLCVAYHQMTYDESGIPTDSYFIDANTNYLELFGSDPRGKAGSEAFPGIEKDTVNWVEIFSKVAKTGQPTRFQQYLQTSNRWFDCVVFQYKSDHFVTALLEITEQRKLEQQLRQAQKMDAIGQLAGGIAHDFNNVLGGILGAAELLVMQIGNDKRAAQYLKIIQESSARASDLVRKLLAFGRQNNLVATPVDSHKAVYEAAALLNCSVDKKVKIELSLKATNSIVIGDLSQLQNVFLNVGINASHAMPDGGLFSVESRNVVLDDIGASAYGVQSGAYIKFELRDTGCGIKAENLPKIFEPFFTTKAQGKGSGLGLAAAFGTIKQHGGAISVYSEIGVGTVFHILLPLTEMAGQVRIKATAPVHGHGRVLVIDDEQIIRVTASAILKQLGYEVIVATNGSEGLEIYRAEHEKIDLVLLDMIMPVMNGRECYEKMRIINPDVKVILASGFSKEEDLKQMKESGLSGFIDKPYGVSELSLLLQKVLQS